MFIHLPSYSLVIDIDIDVVTALSSHSLTLTLTRRSFCFLWRAKCYRLIIRHLCVMCFDKVPPNMSLEPVIAGFGIKVALSIRWVARDAGCGGTQRWQQGTVASFWTVGPHCSPSSKLTWL